MLALSLMVMVDLDTFKDIWGPGRNSFTTPGWSNLDTFKDIWGPIPADATGITAAGFRYLQGYMGTTSLRLNAPRAYSI